MPPLLRDQAIAGALTHQMGEARVVQVHAGDRQPVRGNHVEHLSARDSCRILVSPSVRTLQTAEALGRKYKIHADLAPGSEPDDLLILLRAAQSAQRPDAAAPAIQFIEQHGLEDVRLAPYLGQR